jgi:hypothetical protein
MKPLGLRSARSVAAALVLGAAAAATVAAAGDEAAPEAEAAAPAEPVVETSQTPPVVEPQMTSSGTAQGAPTLIATGAQRVFVKENDFAIVPPKDWEVYTDISGLTMLMQVPHKVGDLYQRTIQVASFSGPRYMDEVTAEEFDETIVRKFRATSASIEDYRVRNHMDVEMADGRDALLFYTEFTLNEVALMQMHVLVSSQTRHYLITYTDLAEHFEKDDANQYLTEAWGAITSVQLGTRTPLRHETFLVIGGGVGGILLLVGIFFGTRAWLSGRKYAQYADGKGLDDVALTDEDKVAASMTPVHVHASLHKTGVTKIDDELDDEMKTGDDIAI